MQAESFLENMAIHCFKEEIDPKESLFQIYSVFYCWLFEYLDYAVAGLFRGKD